MDPEKREGLIKDNTENKKFYRLAIKQAEARNPRSVLINGNRCGSPSQAQDHNVTISELKQHFDLRTSLVSTGTLVVRRLGRRRSD